MLITISTFNRNKNNSLNDRQVIVSSTNFARSTIIHSLVVKSQAFFVGSYSFLALLVVCVVSIPFLEAVNEAFFFPKFFSSLLSVSLSRTYAGIIIVVIAHTNMRLFINNNRFLLLDKLLAQKLVHPFISIMR
jgi:hypothetical protein